MPNPRNRKKSDKPVPSAPQSPAISIRALGLLAVGDKLGSCSTQLSELGPLSRISIVASVLINLVYISHTLYGFI